LFGFFELQNYKKDMYARVFASFFYKLLANSDGFMPCSLGLLSNVNANKPFFAISLTARLLKVDYRFTNVKYTFRTHRVY